MKRWLKAFGRRGSVLVFVLWLLSILTVFSVSLGFSVRQKAQLLSRLDHFSSLRRLAFSGVEKARGCLRTSSIDKDYHTLVEPWAEDPGEFRRVETPEGFFSVESPTGFGLVDEERKINLNTADAATLKRLFEKTGELDSEKAEAAAHAVVDWRDSDSNFQHPNFGAEDDTYTQLGKPYEAKDLNFEILDELLLVQGITPELFGRIKPFVTVHGTGQVNINTAPKKVLEALGLEERTVEKILSTRKGPDEKEPTADDRAFTLPDSIVSQLDRNVPPLDSAERAQVGNLVSAQKLGVRSTFFSARCVATLARDGSSMEIEAVFDRKGRTYYLKTSEIQWPSR